MFPYLRKLKCYSILSPQKTFTKIVHKKRSIFSLKQTMKEWVANKSEVVDGESEKWSYELERETIIRIIRKSSLFKAMWMMNIESSNSTPLYRFDKSIIVFSHQSFTRTFPNNPLSVSHSTCNTGGSLRFLSHSSVRTRPSQLAGSSFWCNLYKPIFTTDANDYQDNHSNDSNHDPDYSAHHLYVAKRIPTAIPRSRLWRTYDTAIIESAFLAFSCLVVVVSVISFQITETVQENVVVWGENETAIIVVKQVNQRWNRLVLNQVSFKVVHQKVISCGDADPF